MRKKRGEKEREKREGKSDPEYRDETVWAMNDEIEGKREERETEIERKKERERERERERDRERQTDR